MEAWLHGCASDAQVPRLKELLDGLAAGPAADVAQLTVCLSAPPVDADSAATEVFLKRDVSRPQSTWRVPSAPAACSVTPTTAHGATRVQARAPPVAPDVRR
jgi:hypothetical protein